MIDKKWLREKYWKEGLSHREIAKLVNSSPSSVCRLMKKFSIKMRGPGMLGINHSEETKKKIGALLKGSIPWNLGKKHTRKSKKKMSELKKGENHPRWKGGLSRYYGTIAHRVWEEHWNQKVPKGYLLHHIDENRRNNDICNIPLLTLSFHTGLHNRKRGGNNDKYSRSIR